MRRGRWLGRIPLRDSGQAAWKRAPNTIRRKLLMSAVIVEHNDWAQRGGIDQLLTLPAGEPTQWTRRSGKIAGHST